MEHTAASATCSRRLDMRHDRPPRQAARRLPPMPALSPLAPAGFPELKPIAGVRLAAYAAGVRYTGRNDVMLAELAPGTTIAGVLTQSTTPGAPVDWCRACLPREIGRASCREKAESG